MENTEQPGMICGHCGSQVRSGFKVCAACGANYRNSLTFGRLLLVALLCVIGGWWLMNAFYVPGLVAFAAAVFVLYMALKKRWFRRND